MTNPVEMPNPLPANSKNFDLNYIQDISPVGTGFIQTIERASPRWLAKYDTPPLQGTAEQTMQAFLDSLEGASVPFLAYDPRRSRPLVTRGGIGSPWERVSGTPPQVLTGTYATATLTMGGLTTGFVISSGDYVAFKISNAWYLHRTVVGATTDGAGHASLVVVPRPVTFTTPVDARLNRPCCAMKVLPSKVQKSDNISDGGPKWSFQGVQYIDLS